MISLLNKPLLKNINFFILIMAVLVAACKKDGSTSPKAMPLAVPANFPAVAYDLSSNPLTEEGFTLGHAVSLDIDAYTGCKT